MSTDSPSAPIRSRIEDLPPGTVGRDHAEAIGIAPTRDDAESLRRDIAAVVEHAKMALVEAATVCYGLSWEGRRDLLREVSALLHARRSG